MAPVTSATEPGDDETRTGAVVRAATAPLLLLPERYEDLRQLGSGGFGEVRRVRDRHVGRVVAMKILRPDETPTPALRARFFAEIKLTAGLSHPGIVPVHDHGELPDGRLWFTMAEVRGRTLRAVIDEAAAAPDAHARRRRLIDIVARVCETVAYAHSRGVIHRDLKPANIMVGEFGQVLVMDWGIARGYSAAEEPEAALAPGSADPTLTRAGDVIGTPAYMAPEQARGEVHRHGPATDVYALGALLYHVLAGRPPRLAPTSWRSDEDPGAGDDLEDAPAELRAICRRATAAEPEARYADAGALAAALTAFLDDARRRERALAALDQAAARGAALEALRARAEEARIQARKALSTVRPSDGVEVKLPGWDLEDTAEALERDVALGETEWIQAVQGALAVDPALPEAHAALADHYRDKLVDAERSRRRADAARFEVMLRAHDRGRYAAFLRGDGAITLVTDPPGARVTLHRHVMRARRLVAERIGEIGPTPLVELPLAHGSYLLVIAASGRAEVRYPVRIDRGEHWDGRAPGDAAPWPIRLPEEGEIGPDDVVIPAGHAWTGGDPEAADGLPRRRVWIDGFVLRRCPVTNRELLVFLDDVASGRLDAAALGLPPAHPGVIEAALGLTTARSGTSVVADVLPGVARDAAGRFVLSQKGPDAHRQLDWPAIVDGHMALAYARWIALREGKPWRLPDELEREKAARGADGRLFPWGDHAEPAFARVLEVQRDEPRPAPVGIHPVDESPYGVRDLAGNVRDWCANGWRHDGPRIEEGRLRLESADPGGDDFWAVRGGGWGSSIVYSRAAVRFGSRPGMRKPLVGIRIARSYP